MRHQQNASTPRRQGNSHPIEITLAAADFARGVVGSRSLGPGCLRAGTAMVGSSTSAATMFFQLPRGIDPKPVGAGSEQDRRRPAIFALLA